MVRVSVVIPVYNAEKYLRECLDSLVGQTLKEMEIICVDDGSTDHSAEILKEYAGRDKRMRMIQQENAGYGHAMNVGIAAAQGEYIGIVEPDDCIRTDMYERLYSVASKFRLDILKSDFYCLTGNGLNRKLEYTSLCNRVGIYGKVLNPGRHLDIFRLTKSNWSGIYKRELIEKKHVRHNETPGAAFQDNGFWFQAFCHAKRIYFLKEAFYMYRTDNPASSVHDRAKVYCVCEEYAFIRKFLEQDKDLKQKFLGIFAVAKYHAYQFALGHIGAEYYSGFIQRFSREFRESEYKGELSKEYFRPSEWRMLRKIMFRPKRFLNELQKTKNLRYRISYWLENYGVSGTCRKVMRKLFGARA